MGTLVRAKAAGGASTGGGGALAFTGREDQAPSF
jgi:hypothetical protein